MRQYRGQRKDNGKWVYGFYVQRSHKDCCVYHYIYTGFYFEDEEREGTELEIYEVVPETVGQETGKLDKTGAKTYIGQRLKNDSGREYKIVWVDLMAAVWFVEVEQPYKKYTAEVISVCTIHDKEEQKDVQSKKPKTS